MTTEPRTASLDHDVDWRNLLNIAEAAGIEYGLSRGRVMPAMEMLQRAVTILRGTTDAPAAEAVRDAMLALAKEVEGLPVERLEGNGALGFEADVLSRSAVLREIAKAAPEVPG